MSKFTGFRPFAISLLVIFLSTGWFLSTATAQTDDPVVRMNDTLMSQVETVPLSGSVLVGLGDEILLSEGYNLANREWGIPNTADTKFPIGDITKQFIAIAILMLQERGSLSLQDPLCQYIEECPAIWENITVGHLLTHTSGIPSTDLTPNNALFVPERAIERLSEEELLFEPGTAMRYSNPAYVMLLHIIEQASGESYATYLQENIFEPLGMVNTGFDRINNVIGQRAEGYSSATSRTSLATNLAYAQLGSMYSTVGDLFLWNRALHGGEFISDAMRETMLEAAAQNPDLSWTDSFGLFTETTLATNHPAILHSSFGAGGFNGCLVHLPNEDMDVVVLKNLDPNRQHPCIVARLLVSTYFMGA